jgi:anti-sigma regulatory factor (Ser/Thr protein kinase)
MNSSSGDPDLDKESSWRTLSEFTLPGEPGNDRLAVEKVVDVVQTLPLSEERLERLKTAVAEATLNALEHGSRYQHEMPVAIRVRASDRAVSIAITNFGSRNIVPSVEAPDLAAKIRGQQSPRGWGFFLIEHMVDEYQISNQPAAHTLELFLYFEGD